MQKFFSGFLFLGLLMLTALQATAQQDAARITAARVRGEVFATIKATGVRSPLVENAVVAQGAIVSTSKDSSVVLVFSNGATVSLSPESDLDIEEFTQDPFPALPATNPANLKQEPSKSATKLMLTRGELVGKVAKLNKAAGSTFSVGTPVGAAGIRGTTFRIVFRPDGTGKADFALTVLEGNVQQTIITGTVTTTVNVTDNQEYSIKVNVTVDPVTGNLHVASTSTGQPAVVVAASAASLQQILGSAQQIAQTLANIVITNPPGGLTDIVPPALSENDQPTPGAGR
jgi:hypothetical protein